jgi:hypothetical protein
VVLPLRYVPFNVIDTAFSVDDPVDERVLPAEIVREATALVVTFSVTVYPPSIVTASPAPGTDAPAAPPDVADHVAVAFQFPLATENLVAAETEQSPAPIASRNK